MMKDKEKRKILGRKRVAKLFSIVLIACTITLTFNVQPVSAQDWWPMFHHDTCFSGYSSSEAPNYGNIKWISDYGCAGYTSPVVVNNKIYISEGDTVCCLNALTEDLIWAKGVGDYASSSPAFYKESLFVYVKDRIYCFNALNGDSIWCRKIGLWGSSHINVNYEKVYAGTIDGEVYCLNSKNGDSIWCYETGYEIYNSSPAVANNKVYIAATNNVDTTYLYCLNAMNGDSIWSYYIEHNDCYSSPAVYNGKVYLGAGNTLFCFDASNGNLIWDDYCSQYSFLFSSPAVANGRVYIGTWGSFGSEDSGSVLCFNASNGDLIWDYSTYGFVSSSPAVADNKVYVGSGDGQIPSAYGGNIYCIDAITGDSIWTYETGTIAVPTSPAVADGIVYIGNGRLYAFSDIELAGPWPMFHHDPSHSGFSSSTAPNNNNILWSYTTGGPVYSSAAVSDDKIYIGSSDCNFYCLDKSTGAFVWSYKTGDVISWSSPAIGDGKMYGASRDGNIYCLDAEGNSDGTTNLKWSYATGADAVESSPTISFGKVYIGASDGKLYCLDASTGNLVWSYLTDWRIDSSPAVAYGKVYFGSGDDKVYCLNASNGVYIWSYDTEESISQTSPAVLNDRVYIGSDDSLYCLEAATGNTIWTHNLNGSYSCPAIVNDRVFVTSILDSAISCLDALGNGDGTTNLIWSYKTGFWVVSSPAVADNKVYIGSMDKKLYCLSASDGDTIWSYLTDGFVSSSPAVADGKVFLGSHDKTIYAFGPPLSQYVLTITATLGGNTTPEPDTHTYSAGSPTGNISASPDEGYMFIHWERDGKNFETANPISLTMNSHHSLHAVFAETKYLTIEATENGYTDPGEGTEGYACSSYVEVTAYPDPDNVLHHWELDEINVGSANPYTVFMDTDHTLVAVIGTRDGAVTSVVPGSSLKSSTSLVDRGSIPIYVTVENQGDFTETIDVTAKYDSTPIGTKSASDLPASQDTVMVFTWNTSGLEPGDYNISAYAHPLPGETDTADNTCSGGTVTLVQCGDVNGDDLINLSDVIYLANYYLGTGPPPFSLWASDVNCDTLIDLSDVIHLANYYFGKPGFESLDCCE